MGKDYLNYQNIFNISFFLIFNAFAEIFILNKNFRIFNSILFCIILKTFLKILKFIKIRVYAICEQLQFKHLLFHISKNFLRFF